MLIKNVLIKKISSKQENFGNSIDRKERGKIETYWTSKSWIHFNEKKLPTSNIHQHMCEETSWFLDFWTTRRKLEPEL